MGGRREAAASPSRRPGPLPILLNTGQQVGGAIGLAALGTVVWTVVANSVKYQLAQAAAGGHPRLAAPSAGILDHALAAGFSRGFLISFAIIVLALAVAAALVREPCHVHADHPVPVGCPGTHWRRPRVLASQRSETY